MADIAHVYTDKQIQKLQHELDIVYKQAEIDIRHKMEDFNKKYHAKEEIHQKELRDGKITQEQYDNWVKGQVFQGQQWQAKHDQILDTMHRTNEVATNMINGQTQNVFMTNANYMSYSMEHGTGINFGFGIYDNATVANLIKDDPQLLPKWKIDEKKDYTWSNKKLNRSVTQGIIQGESLDKIADRLSKNLVSQNKDKMKTFARTAMTGAQNSGRLTSMRNAKDLGIDLQKEWMATLDSHTRDSHADVDGERVDVNSKFSNGLMYPGEAGGAPAEVYNCRCTMVSDIKKYPDKYKRYDNIDGKPIDNMSYKEWAKAKGLEKKRKPNAEAKAKRQIEKYKNQIQNIKDELKKMSEDAGVYSGIWYKDVTLEDYAAKKETVEAKREWFNDELDKLRSVENPTQEQLDKIAKFENNLKRLEEYEKKGEAYLAKQKEITDLQKEINDLKKQLNPKIGGDALSQERKDAALWAQSSREADTHLRPRTGEVWKAASQSERDAIYDYTISYSKFNEPLRGWEYGETNYRTGAGFKGVGNTDLDASYTHNGKQLNDMTNIIGKCVYDEDVWLQRGCDFAGMDSFFNVSKDLLTHGTQEELNDALLGTMPTEYGFMSCGSSKGQGFTGDIMLNIYAPSGTQMMYVEPFSHYGHGARSSSWDGESGQSSFGSELETILQQGTQFQVTKVERSYGTLYIDLEVIGQLDPQRWTP